jgi:hypothetical protein
VGSVRVVAGRVVGVVGLVLYNWWLGALVHGGIVSSPNALFSDLEASGGRYALVFSRLDIAAGVLLLVALLLRGRWGLTGVRREWWLLLVFAAAGAVGGFFPYSCPEGVNAVCRTAEWEFQLPWRQYVHVGAGIVEFAGATLAIVLARRRTAGLPVLGGLTRWTANALLVAYPLLGVAYLSDRLGAFVEPVFFVCFSLMVAVELFEPEPALVPAGKTSGET